MTKVIGIDGQPYTEQEQPQAAAPVVIRVRIDGPPPVNPVWPAITVVSLLVIGAVLGSIIAG
ncbi:hypothetical protein [Aliiruegeria lutimaris]|uniref:Uncharacterized protein n=1 Tax=Aliiruegeria lutimaris TaxID=571298 RepID=A0A1G9PH00_9RHOB|nr:hypothetical protein [Aliiruegeria lutimaris]SDL98004.1 hypothetical protein SAMN04488026_11412 [Aliiruegeria lutimaris]